MNRLVIIGNGFDKVHGLKTLFSEFLFEIVDQSFQSALKTLKGHLFGIEILFKGNFKNLRLSENSNSWVEYVSSLMINSNLDNHYVKIKFSNSILEHAISKYPQSNWDDLESNYFNLLKEANTSRSKEWIKKLNNDWVDLKGYLHDYLKKELENSNPKILAEGNDLFFQIFESTTIANYAHTDLNQLIVNRSQVVDYNDIHFLNFNYTDTIEAYIEKKEYSDFQIPKRKSNYIHGVLNESFGNSEGLVFGYGNEDIGQGDNSDERIINTWKRNHEKENLKNIKSFNYLKTRAYQKLLKFIRKGSFEVLIFGHGCGNSDGTLLKTILNNDKCILIKIFYYNEEDYLDKIYRLSNHLKDPEIFRSKILNFEDSEPMAQAIIKNGYITDKPISFGR